MNDEKSRYVEIRRELDALGAGKVRILGVTKGQTIDRIRSALADGLDCLGVNYVQPGRALKTDLSSFSILWHFIGHIQSRKVRDLLDYDLIESLDRLSVAEELDRRCAAVGKTLPVLVEVNIGEEVGKSGVAPSELDSFLSGLRNYSSLQVKGLMSLPPPLMPVENRRPWFRRLKRLYEERRQSYPFEILSMGTSDDYSIAVAEGATQIRLGTALFGNRLSP